MMGRFVEIGTAVKKTPVKGCRPNGTGSFLAPIPGTDVPGFHMPSLRDWGFLIFVFVFIFITTLSGAQVLAQSGSAPSTDSKPKADAIFLHANIYTGVPASSQFSSV